jgi:hypothetical protein
MKEFSIVDLRNHLTEKETTRLTHLLRHKVPPCNHKNAYVKSFSRHGPCTKYTILNLTNTQQAIDYIEHLVEKETRKKLNVKRNAYLKALYKIKTETNND